MRLSLLAMFCIIAFAIAFAQNPSPRFEIATVKSPGPQNRIITLYNYPGGRVVISPYTFALLLHYATMEFISSQQLSRSMALRCSIERA